MSLISRSDPIFFEKLFGVNESLDNVQGNGNVWKFKRGTRRPDI